LLARFGATAFLPAKTLVHLFRSERTKALFAGLAAHSFLSLDEPLSARFGIILGAAAHAVGWPIPRGGAQSITSALCAHLATLGGNIKTSTRIEDLSSVESTTPFSAISLLTNSCASPQPFPTRFAAN